MRRAARILVVGLLLLVPPTASSATPEDAFVMGVVGDAVTGQPVPASRGVTVTLSSVDQPRPPLATVVNETSEFRIEAPAGSYWLRAEADGYEAAYFGPLNLAGGSGATAHLSLSRSDVPRYTAAAPLRTQESAFQLVATPDLRRWATAARGDCGDAPRCAVVLFDLDATARWSRPVSAATPGALETALDISSDGNRVAFTSVSELAVLDANGGVEWTRPAATTGGREVLRFSPDATQLVFAGREGRLAAHDADSGAVQWNVSIGAQATALRFSDDGWALFALAEDGRLRKLNSTTGQEQWSVPVPTPSLTTFGVNADATRILVASTEGSVQLLDPDGVPRWSRQVPGPLLGADLAPTGRHVALLTGQGVHLLDGNGQQRWFRGEDQPSGSVQMGTAGLTIGYVTVGGTTPYARVVDLNGTLRWQAALEMPARNAHLRVGDDGGRIIVGTEESGAYLFPQWKSAGVPSSPAPCCESPSPTSARPSPAWGVPSLGAALAILWLFTQGRVRH